MAIPTSQMQSVCAIPEERKGKEVDLISKSGFTKRISEITYHTGVIVGLQVNEH